MIFSREDGRVLVFFSFKRLGPLSDLLRRMASFLGLIRRSCDSSSESDTDSSISDWVNCNANGGSVLLTARSGIEGVPAFPSSDCSRRDGSSGRFWPCEDSIDL
ncbi:hypothetical protein WICPIJ_000191 [Wickerhamomyces pijperi]|uniref:Uncharacterized protein n=1 Tax=Wickerhamomyces pijperi TaxID=599730 RepID=A0A9P8TS53_WICPI|nr:hypothetical protein WICPIJ_000191 [Wickerhamomyces pijperi]